MRFLAVRNHRSGQRVEYQSITAPEGRSQLYRTSSSPDRQARLERLDRMANKLDARFSVMGLRFGWDSILGLIPGIGDAATAIPGAYMIYEGARMGARKRVLGRMGANTAIDLVIGGIPVIGDAFDLFFKANRRNIAMLKRELGRQDDAINLADGKDTQWQSGKDPKTANAIPTTSSDPRGRSTKPDVMADDSRATSQRKTN